MIIVFCLKILDFNRAPAFYMRGYGTKNFGSVGQSTAKLLAVKVGVFKKKSAGPPRPHLNQSASVRFRARANNSQSLVAGNFAAL